MPRIIVVGGGISGLATAHFLLDEAPDLDVEVFESENRLGGTLGTENREGFVFERGANGFLGNVPHTLELARELGLGDRVRTASGSKRRYIYKKGKLHAVPTSPMALLRSPLLSLPARLRVFMEYFTRKKAPEGQDESVASFGRRRLGEEAMRTFLDPLASGIYGGDVERLSMRSAFPRVAQLELLYGGLIRGMIERRREERSTGIEPSPMTTAELCSFPEGLGELVAALEKRLHDRLRPGRRVASLRRDHRSFVLKGPGGLEERADGVVLALPAYRAATLFGSEDPETARAFELIPYAPIAAVCLGYPRERVDHPLDGYGFLVPRNQGLRTLGTIWVSSLYPEHVPEGHVSIRCMVGGARDPDILNRSDEFLLDLILTELRPILGIEGAPTAHRIFRYARGIPQYNIGHSDRIERLERRFWDLPGIFITGNAYRGVGLNDCVREAHRIAVAVKENFRT